MKKGLASESLFCMENLFKLVGPGGRSHDKKPSLLIRQTDSPVFRVYLAAERRFAARQFCRL